MKKKLSIVEMVLTGAFAALLAVLSQFAIPMPSGVPATLQTFAVALCGFVLGARQGAVCVGVYLLMGAVGLPVFAGFHGGIGAFIGVTGGFLWGFIALSALCGTRRPALAAAGLVLCHALGVAQFALVAGMSFGESAALVSLPFLLKDALSVGAAYAASAMVLRGLRAAHLV